MKTLIFSTLLCLCFIAVSEQQDHNANFEKYDLPIENTEGVSRRTQRNPEHHQWDNRTKKIGKMITPVPCTDLRPIYEKLGYKTNPEILTSNYFNQWIERHVKPISDENKINHDSLYFQHGLTDVEKLPHKQVSPSVPTESLEKFTRTTTIKVPEKIADSNIEIVPEPVSDINTHKHKTIAYTQSEEKDALEFITEPSSPFEESADYNSEATNIKYQKQPIQGEHLKYKAEASPKFEKLPEYILKHRHNEAIPYYFGILPVEIDHQTNEPAQSIEDKDKSTKPFISERRAFSENEDKLPDYIGDYDKTYKIQINERPIDYTQSEFKPIHTSEELPDYIHNHNHNEAVTSYFESFTEKSSEKGIHKDKNKPTQSLKDKEESTEPYISEKEDQLPDYFSDYNKTNTVQFDKRPIDYIQSEFEPIHTSEDLPDYILKHNHDEAVTYYFESFTEKSSEKSIHKDKKKPTHSLKDKEESSEPYISKKGDQLPDYFSDYKTNKIQSNKRPIDYIQSEFKPIHTSEELPDYILKHNHNVAVTNYFESFTEKSSEKDMNKPTHKSSEIDEQSIKPTQNIGVKEESKESDNSETRILSETDNDVPNYIHKRNKTTILKHQIQPDQDYLESETEPNSSSITEELPEQHKHDDGVAYDFDIFSVKLPEKINEPAQNIEADDLTQINYPTISAQNTKYKEESTKPYYSEKENQSPDHFDNYKKINKIKLNKQPIQIDFIESETEINNPLDDLPAYIFQEKYYKTVPYYFEFSTTKSSEIEEKSKKPAQSIGDKDESKDSNDSETRILSETDNDVPNYIQKRNKTTILKHQIQPDQDYLESETEPNSSSTAEELPEQHKHDDAVAYYFDIFSDKLPEKINEPAQHIEADPLIMSTKNEPTISAQKTEDKEESKKPLIETEEHTKSSVIPDIYKTTHEFDESKHEHSTSVAPVICGLNKEELTEDARRSMSLENDLSIKPPITTKNQPKFLKKLNIHDNRQKEIFEKNQNEKLDIKDTNRFGSNAYSTASIVPIRNNYYPVSKPGFLLQPTYYLMDPTKGAGISPLSYPKTLMMESSKVCYACSTLNDASCWSPDRMTTVKYCRPGYDLCVTKIYKTVSKLGMIVIRDCSSACDLNMPGLDTHSDSCAICKEDLCNNVALENSAFTMSQSNILSILAISAVIKSMY